jgi:hypothetical protein
MRLVSLISLAVMACGGSHAGTSTDAATQFPDAPTNPTMRYEPWKVGSTWSYKFTDPTGAKPPATGRITSIGAMEDVGGLHAGQMAFKVNIQTLGGSKIVWEVPSGDLDIRYKTAYYDANGVMTETDVEQPYRLKLDEGIAHTMTNATFSETFTENVAKVGMAPSSKNETLQWKVISDNESLTVIAGPYTKVLHVQRYNAAKPETVDYWYARGVGKLKESGGNNDEELESYTP